jgi:hypothetical protein
MPEPSPQVSEIVRLLPLRLQSRFYSLGGYVRAVLDELGEEETREIKLSNEAFGFIQLAVFIYSLDWFLREGTRAAKASVTALEEFGYLGFSVGSTVFTRDSENTYLGENLANDLIKVLGDSLLARHIKEAKNIPSLIRTLRNELSRG